MKASTKVTYEVHLALPFAGDTLPIALHICQNYSKGLRGNEITFFCFSNFCWPVQLCVRGFVAQFRCVAIFAREKQTRQCMATLSFVPSSFKLSRKCPENVWRRSVHCWPNLSTRQKHKHTQNINIQNNKQAKRILSWSENVLGMNGVNCYKLVSLQTTNKL